MGVAAALAQTTLDEAPSAVDAVRIELDRAQIELEDRTCHRCEAHLLHCGQLRCLRELGMNFDN